jgi:hypothetical protein
VWCLKGWEREKRKEGRRKRDEGRGMKGESRLSREDTQRA